MINCNDKLPQFSLEAEEQFINFFKIKVAAYVQAMYGLSRKLR